MCRHMFAWENLIERIWEFAWNQYDIILYMHAFMGAPQFS